MVNMSNGTLALDVIAHVKMQIQYKNDIPAKRNQSLKNKFHMNSVISRGW